MRGTYPVVCRLGVHENEAQVGGGGSDIPISRSRGCAAVPGTVNVEARETEYRGRDVPGGRSRGCAATVELQLVHRPARTLGTFSVFGARKTLV